MKRLFGFFTVLAVSAAVFSCDIFPLPDNPDSEDDGKIEDDEQVENGGVVNQDKKIKQITRSWKTEHRKMLAEVQGNEADGGSDMDAGVESLGMTYDLAGRVSAIRYEGGVWNDTRYILEYSLDYGTKGEIRVTRRRMGGPEWVDPLLYVRLPLDDKGYATSYWQSTTSAFLNMSEFEKMCDLSYSADGRVTSLIMGEEKADFVYTDGMLTSLSSGEGTSDFYSWEPGDYAGRKPAKGNSSALITFLTMQSEEFEDPFVFMSLVGCIGKMSDYLLDKTDNLESFMLPEAVTQYTTPDKVYYCTRYFGNYMDEMTYSYEFDTDGYVTDWTIGKGFDIVKEDYEIHVGNEWDGNSYNHEKKNSVENTVKSGTDTVTYEIEYL